MNTSRYIARLMGPVLLIIGIGMIAGLFVEAESYSSLMKEFIGSRALIFITGVLALLAGLAIVNAHNLWVPDWRVVVRLAVHPARHYESRLSRRGADHGRPHRSEPWRSHRRSSLHYRARRHPLDYGL